VVVVVGSWFPTPSPTNLSCFPLTQILKSNMKEELAGLKSSYTISDLVRTPVIRHIFFCLSIIWWGWAGEAWWGGGRGGEGGRNGWRV